MYIYIQYSGIYIDYSYYSYEYTVSKHVDIFWTNCYKEKQQKQLATWDQALCPHPKFATPVAYGWVVEPVVQWTPAARRYGVNGQILHKAGGIADRLEQSGGEYQNIGLRYTFGLSYICYPYNSTMIWELMSHTYIYIHIHIHIYIIILWLFNIAMENHHL